MDLLCSTCRMSWTCCSSCSSLYLLRLAPADLALLPPLLVVGEEHRTEDRGQRTEDRGLMTEDRGERTEDRGLITEDRGLMTEDRAVVQKS